MSNLLATFHRQALALSEAKQRKPAIVSLVKSLKCYNSNWSAWLKLADLIDGEEEVSRGLACPHRHIESLA